ncbi:phospholipase D-like domain-containing protein [Sphingomonas nostoxanthinifaciens]|uniref:phospholipase D-like domain-containing protein n=1 Tax=Sphingomonas nostoxanthinifaciens TaxID=2872652 RepID=UPI001CC1E89F|nr:phospholipase D-like domain-containing protein [Sphingomonas nostoxanthinifaciens]UAK24831.1 cardiolipin synthase [Sphingomonas nostoxanthinifaciens]
MHSLLSRVTPSAGEFYYIAEWLVRLGALGILPWRRSPAAVRSWLLLIFFLPIPGLILFLMIGRPKFPKWRHDRFRALDPFATAIAERLSAAAAPTLDTAEREVSGLACTLGRLPPVAGNAVDLLDDYDEVIDRLVADIDGARIHVRILAYIFADDRQGVRVIDALGRAVARGVPCHVILDPVGSHQWRAGAIAKLEAAGVAVREALPFRWLRDRTRRDMRNHRKLFVIDGAIGYAGSQNIVAKDFAPGIVNHELVVRATGPVVAEMATVFIADWYLETEEMLEAEPAIPAPAGDAICQLLPSGADFPLEGFETLLVWQMHRACTRAMIVTPYLIPDDDLIGAMRTAVARGVTVDLVVSKVVDHRIVNLAQSSYYDELMAAGVRVHRYRDELLHAKNLSIDGRLGIAGSSNVDIRSFQLNEEVSLLLLDPASIARLEKVQQGYLDRSELLDLTQWRRRSRLRRTGEAIARLVSPLL